MTFLCPFTYIFIVTNLNYFGTQIVPDLASVSPLKLEVWILSQLQWSGMIEFAYKTTLTAVRCIIGAGVRKQGDLIGSCVVQVEGVV